MNESTYQERTASVLVVDDDPIVRILAREALEKTGFTVMETDNGREALSVFKRQQPDIVLLDVLMPQIDGFEVCVSLRELAGGRHVPVVIMTALEDIESVNHAYQAGATDFITKPINWTLLEHRVRYILRASQTERALRDARHQLEKRVEERTAELSQANARLTLEIEDRKRAEQELKSVYHDLQISQMQLVQSAKLASIGELASGIAHELNQPLMVIRTAAQLALRRCHEGDEHYDKLKLVENGTTRMSRIIDHLRTFSRQSKANVQPVDINQVIRDALLMTGEQLRLRAIEVVLDFQENLPRISGDATQLEQVLLNLIINARDAIEEKRSTSHESKGVLRICSRIAPNASSPAIQIVFSDSGSGICEENLSRVFDPFFTTKKEGRGTGLGLAISYGIIKEHNGEIQIAETGPQGTTFEISLPILENKAKIDFLQQR